MGFFHDGNNDDMVDFMNQVPGQLMKIFRLGTQGWRMAVKDIQKGRANAAMQRAINNMPQQVQSPDSPLQSPSSRPPAVASADLSPPPAKR